MRRVAIVLGVLVAGCGCGFALNPSLDISQYGHTRVDRPGRVLRGHHLRDGPDARWVSLAGRGIRLVSLRWRSQLSPGNHLRVSISPTSPYSLLVTRDGTLWIGTFAGLVSWNGGKLTRYPELDGLFVTSLLEDREGTVWAGILGGSPGTPTGRLCAIRSGSAQCYGEDGAFGSFVWSLGEDSSGTLWAGAESGLWRWKPGPPRRYATPGMRIGDLSKADDGRLLIGMQRRRTQAARRRQSRIVPDSQRNPSECDCCRTAMSIRINCSGTAMEVSGSEPTSGGSSMYITAGQTYLAKSDGLSGDIICQSFRGS